MSANLNLSKDQQWLRPNDRPVLISGPCSAESEEQVMQTCKELAATGKVEMLRAGIWKPRTRPNSFEGIGEPGLKWLTNAGKEFNLPVCTEVANAKHVEACLRAGVNVMWIGARTTVNPFAVQEIADALKGTDTPVIVKNPINPDLQLWIGALERLNAVGLTKLAVIHRGFSSHEKSAFRNKPMWEFPIELKRLIPELPIICDPSHIAGNRELIPFISQKALDLDFDGLMIESHIQPKVALSDAGQQLTPHDLNQLIEELTVRKATATDLSFRSHLEELRVKIDGLDEQIIETLAARMDIAEEIGNYKRDHDVTILQVNRWDEVIKKRLSMGTALGLSDVFVKKLLQIIHKESIRKQTEVMNRELAD